MSKKYLVIGGLVHSKHDNDVHYVSALELCRLYRVQISDCILTTEVQEARFRFGQDLPILRPRYDGNYALPKSNE